jgi:hypothetical protein
MENRPNSEQLLPHLFNIRVEGNHMRLLSGEKIDVQVVTDVLEQDLEARLKQELSVEGHIPRDIAFHLGGGDHTNFIRNVYQGDYKQRSIDEIVTNLKTKIADIGHIGRRGIWGLCFNNRSASKFGVFINTPKISKGVRVKPAATKYYLARTWAHEATHIIQALTTKGRRQSNADNIRLGVCLFGPLSLPISHFGLSYLHLKNTQQKITRRDALKFICHGIITASTICSLPKTADRFRLFRDRSEQEANLMADRYAFELQQAFEVNIS